MKINNSDRVTRPLPSFIESGEEKPRLVNKAPASVYDARTDEFLKETPSDSGERAVVPEKDYDDNQQPAASDGKNRPSPDKRVFLSAKYASADFTGPETAANNLPSVAAERAGARKGTLKNEKRAARRPGGAKSLNAVAIDFPAAWNETGTGTVPNRKAEKYEEADEKEETAIGLAGKVPAADQPNRAVAEESTREQDKPVRTVRNNGYLSYSNRRSVRAVSRKALTVPFPVAHCPDGKKILRPDDSEMPKAWGHTDNLTIPPKDVDAAVSESIRHSEPFQKIRCGLMIDTSYSIAPSRTESDRIAGTDENRTPCPAKVFISYRHPDDFETIAYILAKIEALVETNKKATDESSRIWSADFPRSSANCFDSPDDSGQSTVTEKTRDDNEKNAPPAVQSTLPVSTVQFSAISPQTLVKGEYFMIRIIMYEESARQVVDELLRSMDKPANETKKGTFRVRDGASVTIVLESPELTIDDSEDTGIWQGNHLDFSFCCLLPHDFPEKQVRFYASVYINHVLATKLRFFCACDTSDAQKMTVLRKDIHSAFVSYAHEDMHQVARLIQGMKAARSDLEVFFDVTSLRCGALWENVIRDEIDRRDIMFLCWSHFARDSFWVETEWKYALAHKGADFIEPLPIESPEICPPPEELHKKHFNDIMLYFINAK